MEHSDASRYVAHASVARNASQNRIQSAFKIEVRFIGGLSTAERGAFKRAADRWTRVIIGDLPAVTVDGEEIDDLLILAEGRKLDGRDGVLGQSGPTVLRPKTAGPHAYLPARGEMTFDTDDLAAMQREGTLGDVIAHEMGHVLGFGTVWARKRLLRGATSGNPTFHGAQARSEYARLVGAEGKLPVPVENLGGKGTRNSHWRESVFGNELMSGFVAQADNPLSRLTIASLADLGYTVDLDAAESFELPSARAKLVAATLAQRPMLRPPMTVLPS